MAKPCLLDHICYVIAIFDSQWYCRFSVCRGALQMPFESYDRITYAAELEWLVSALAAVNTNNGYNGSITYAM